MPSDEHSSPGSQDGECDADAELLRRIRSGDTEALDALIRRHWEPLLRYAASIAPEVSDPQDLVQEALVRLWSRRSELDVTGNLAALLYRITRNLALNEQRRRQVRTRSLAGSEPAYPVSPEATPLERAEEGELRRAARDAVQGLSPRRREVFILSRFHGRRYREIADIMEISEQTVANHMSAALDALRRSLAPYLEERTELREER